jgi:hypothetical protein
MVTMSDGHGGTIQQTVTPPWDSPSFTVRTGAFLYVSAQSHSGDRDDGVDVEIYEDGKGATYEYCFGPYCVTSSHKQAEP